MKWKIICLAVAMFLSISSASVVIGNSNDELVPEGETIESEDSADVPTFEIGDNWTYHRDVEVDVEDIVIYFEETFTYTVSGLETYTYEGTEYYCYNLTVEGEITDGQISGDMEVEIDTGEIEGYLLLRVSDLGVVSDYEWRMMEGEVTMGDEVYNATVTLEFLFHDDPVVEEYDFPIELGDEFYANTTRRIRSYYRIEVEDLIDDEDTSYENITAEQHVSTSPEKEDVSVPAGSFSTFELDSTLPKRTPLPMQGSSLSTLQSDGSMTDEEGYLTYNYVPEVKNHVKLESYSPEDDATITEELLDYNVAERSESLSIDPSSGRPGEEVTISGSFPEHPNEDIRIWIPDAGDEYFVTADDGGEFSEDIIVPEAYDRTPSPGEKGSLGVIAELEDTPTEAYAVRTLTIEDVDVEYYELTVNVEGEGTVEVDPEQDEYEQGKEVTLTAEPAEDWYFDEWTGDIDTIEDPQSAETTITMDDDKEITAVFTVEMYEGTIIVDGEGSVIVERYDEEEGKWEEHPESPVEDELTDSSPDGTQIRLTAEPAEDWNFERWTREDYESAEEQIEFTMDEDWEITAIFTDTVYDLDVYVDGEGTVTAEWLDQEETVTDQETFNDVPEGAEVTLTATPDDEWSFDEWTGDVPEGEEDEITIVMDDDKEITAVFTDDVPDEYELTINIEGEGTVEVDGEEVEDGWTGTYGEDTEVDLEAIPDDEWSFVEWTGDYEGTEEEINITMDEDKEITAEFTDEDPANFEVTIDEPEDGAGFEEGDEVTVEFTVENTGDVEDTQDIVFSVDGEEVDTMEMTISGEEEDTGEFTWEAEYEGDYELEVASDDDLDSVTITVEEVVEYTLTLHIEGEAGGLNWDPDPIEEQGDDETEEENTWILTYSEDTEVTLTAVETDEDWYFVEWTGDVPEGEEEEEEITFTMDDDKEITVHFEEDDDIPGFTLLLLVLAVGIAVSIFYMKTERSN